MTKRKNPSLKKYNVLTSTGKTFQIIAASKEQAERMVKRGVSGGKVSNPEMKKPAGFGIAGSGFSKFYRTQAAAEKAAQRLIDKGYDGVSVISHPNNPNGMKWAVLLRRTYTSNPSRNPSELLKSGEWTPAHAVRIRGKKLEILR